MNFQTKYFLYLPGFYFIFPLFVRGVSKNETESIPFEPDPDHTGEGKRLKRIISL